ncbi:MAG: toprim domain-containing protein [Acidimicrobiia bacterium]
MAYDYKEWVEDNLERAKRSAGDEWTATCPSCGKYGGFYVNTDSEGNGPFVCFKCDFAGKHFARLVAEVEGCTYAEALQHMYKEAVTFRRKDTAEGLLERIRALRDRGEGSASADVWDEMADTRVNVEMPRSMLTPVWDGKHWRVPDYMTDRGFQREVLRDWGVGYCVKGSWAVPGARPQWWGGRIIIPIDCPNGRSFTGRDLTDEQEPKYLNPTGADHAQLLIGWKHVKLGADFALVEGPLDAMKLYQWGIPALAFGGKELSTAQLNMLFKHPESTSVTVMLDPDAQANAYRVATQLKVRFQHVFVATIPPTDKAGRKLDPGASTRKQAHRWYDGAPEFTGARGAGTVARIREALAKSQTRFKK